MILIALFDNILYDPQPLVSSPQQEINNKFTRGIWQKRPDGGAALIRGSFVMKKEIHPDYSEITVTCSCGNVIKTRSTVGHNLTLDVCSECHPFYTGKQRVVDTGGRVERFNKRFGMINK